MPSKLPQLVPPAALYMFKTIFITIYITIYIDIYTYTYIYVNMHIQVRELTLLDGLFAS